MLGLATHCKQKVVYCHYDVFVRTVLGNLCCFAVKGTDGSRTGVERRLDVTRQLMLMNIGM
jgi:hypothetical protein